MLKKVTLLVIEPVFEADHIKMKTTVHEGELILETRPGADTFAIQSHNSLRTQYRDLSVEVGDITPCE